MFSPISTAAGGYCGPFCSCILQRGRHMCKALAGPHFAEHGPKFSIFAAGESPLPGLRLVGPASRRAPGKAAGSSRSLHRSATQPRRGQTRHLGAPIAPISAAPSLPSPCTLISRTTCDPPISLPAASPQRRLQPQLCATGINNGSCKAGHRRPASSGRLP